MASSWFLEDEEFPCTYEDCYDFEDPTGGVRSTGLEEYLSIEDEELPELYFPEDTPTPTQCSFDNNSQPSPEDPDFGHPLFTPSRLPRQHRRLTPASNRPGIETGYLPTTSPRLPKRTPKPYSPYTGGMMPSDLHLVQSKTPDYTTAVPGRGFTRERTAPVDRFLKRNVAIKHNMEGMAAARKQLDFSDDDDDDDSDDYDSDDYDSYDYYSEDDSDDLDDDDDHGNGDYGSTSVMDRRSMWGPVHEESLERIERFDDGSLQRTKIERITGEGSSDIMSRHRQ